MLAPVRSPLGAPGAFALPDVAAPLLHPERMDVCAFAGVAPRGPARVPVVDESHPDDWTRITDGRPLQRSYPVLIRSFDEYVHHFGAFEGPGLLPHAVASYFEQGGRLAWVLRIVPAGVAPFNQDCASGELAGAFTHALRFIARNAGTWGQGLRLRMAFSTSAQRFHLGPAGRIEVEPRSAVITGSTLRLTDADGHAALSVCTGVSPVRDPAVPRERLALMLDPPPSRPPVALELVEVVLDIDDGNGRREHFDHLALVPDHPNSLATALCQRSSLVWPCPDWAGLPLTPAQSRVELLVTHSSPFSGGVDGWEDLRPDDFFDPSWSPAAEQPGSGITAFVGVSSEAPPTQLVVPDLYLPAEWAGTEEVEALPPGTAGAEFGDCVNAPGVPAASNTPPSLLTDLILDPRTLAGLHAVADLQQRVIDVCEASQDLIALLDVPPGLSQARIETWRARFDSAWAAAYHPWLVPARRQDDALDVTRQRERRLGPSAVAAGIVARREAARGIHWGPANEIARSIIGSAEAYPEGRADTLQPQGINCLVHDPDGLRLVAARTLSRERHWRQLSVRRLVLMLRRTLLAQMQWAVFEPNAERLWRDLKLAIEGLLRQLFRAGAFAGRSEAESFFVRLLTERQRLDRGELVAEIGVAPAEPLEFILVRLRRDGDGSLNLEG
jgi:hypothetical protein